MINKTRRCPALACIHLGGMKDTSICVIYLLHVLISAKYSGVTIRLEDSGDEC